MNSALPVPAYRAPLATRLRIRLARARRWEFWPAWLFYIPVVIYILYLGLRFRSPTLFTAANPGIDSGGVVGERKSPVLGALQAQAPDLVARFQLLPSTWTFAQRLQQAQAFVDAQQGYPVVLKPEIGSRGRGVAVIRDAPQLEAYLRWAPGDVLIQRHIDGEEFGVFVYREPRSGQARIYSIVNKRFPVLIGDGQRSLLQLIEADERARLIAPLLWQRFAARLQQVPARGEAVPLVEIGSHCRGSLFLDATHLAAPGLQASMQRVFEAVDGFHFGRLDLRCPSAAQLARGEALQILEINGVTAEAAHIYHPDTPLWRGYAAILRQWRIAFEIGRANAQRGAVVTGAFELLRLFREDLRRGTQWF